MPRLRYDRVDVFTDRPFGGNGLAVFAEPPALAQGTMQAIARELNQSETTFVYPPDDAANDYKVRIFTPVSEIPMAGHPTVGTAFVLARRLHDVKERVEAHYRFEEGVGPIEVTVQMADDAPDLIWMRQRPPEFGEPFEDAAAIARMLSLPLEWLATDRLPVQTVSCGVPFFFVPVRDRRALGDIRFRVDVWSDVLDEASMIGVYALTLDAEDPACHVRGRMFAPGAGIPEDPATGAASGPLGCYLVRHGAVAGGDVVAVEAEQGVEMGRPSRISIEVERAGDAIAGVRVGGRCVWMGEGYLDVP